MEMETRKLPPQSIESEMSLLGAIFLENSAIDTVLEIMKVEDFYREAHRKIFLAMLSLSEKNEPIDFVSTAQTLKSTGDLEEVGGGAYLSTLSEYVPTAANIAFYCKTVVKQSHARKLLASTMESTNILFDNHQPIEDVIEKLESAITSVTVAKQSEEPVSMMESLKTTIKVIEQRYERKGEIQGIPYGIPDLDEATNGMQRGDLIIIAGRPSMGKSALAGNISESVCKTGYVPLLFTMEMSRENVTERTICSHGNISYTLIRSGNLSEWIWPKLIKAAGEISQWPMCIDDTPGISFHQLKAKAKRMKRKRLDLIVVDYLQLMTLPAKDSRTQALGEVSRGLKKLARELDVPIVALCQLSRNVESRQDKRPIMSDLRDSGEIEQDADVILFPYRPSVYCNLCRDKVDNGDHNLAEHQAKSEIIIEKQRNGARNISIPTAWIGDNQKFIGLGNPYDY